MHNRGQRGFGAGSAPLPPTNFVGHEAIEENNAYREEELKGKVSALKSLTIEIGAEAREHNRLLKGVDDQFDSTSSLLGNTLNKVLSLAKSGYRYYTFYLLLFCVFVFFVIWYIV